MIAGHPHRGLRAIVNSLSFIAPFLSFPSNDSGFRALHAETDVAQDTIFSRIVRGEIPADIVYQDDLVTAFRDINAQAPTHVLVVPNRVIPTVDDVSERDEAVLGRLFRVAAQVARAEGISESGYRLIVNCREHGGQEVYHLHVHLLGGRPLGRMLPG